MYHLNEKIVLTPTAVLKNSTLHLSGIVFLGIILLPVLFLPLSNDLSIFVRGGETVLAGGKLYRDFVDLKPPLIYYISAIPQLILGSSEFSPRLFDYLWQLATAISLYYVLSKTSQNRQFALMSAATYALLYSILSYSQTFTCEGFSAIALVWLFYFQIAPSHSFIKYCIIGMLIGWCIALKFTLGIILPALIVDDLLKGTFKNDLSGLFKKYSAVMVGIMFIVGLGLFPLFDRETRAEYLNVLHYLVYYTKIIPVNSQFFREVLGNIAGFFGDTFSFALFFGVLSAFIFWKRKSTHLMTKMIVFCSLLTVFLLLSVVIEKRFNAYYFSRIYIPLSILAGYGFAQVFSTLSTDWSKYPLLLKVLVVSVAILTVPFSPIPRYSNMLWMTGMYFVNHNAYEYMFERGESNFLNYHQQKEVARIVNKLRKSNEKVFVMSIGASPVYNFLKIHNASKFAHSQFYYSNGIPQKWLDEARAEVFKTKWLIVQTNDGHPALNGHGRPSIVSLQNDNVLWPFVQQHFDKKDSTRDFIIFQRRGQ